MTQTRFHLALAALSLAVACGDPDDNVDDLVCADPSASDAEEAVLLYLAAWSEEDAFERRCMIQRSLAVDAGFVGAAASVEGRAATVQQLDSRIASLFGQGAIRETPGAMETRHQEARLAWVTKDASGTLIERGEDWLEFDEEGLLLRIHIFAGQGMEASPSDPLLAWERAWNTRDDASRADALSEAATEAVRFTDLLTDVRGRDALGAEIGRQQDLLGGTLELSDRVEIFAAVGAEAVLVRQSAEIVLPQGGVIRVVNYVRLRGGRIERLSGFPSSAL